MRPRPPALLALALLALAVVAVVRNVREDPRNPERDCERAGVAGGSAPSLEARTAHKNRPATRRLTARQGIHRSVREKLDRTVIPLVRFDNTSVEEALDYLRLRARELDPEPDDARKGLGFVIRRPVRPVTETKNDGSLDPGDTTLPGEMAMTIRSLNARNITLRQALDLICEEAQLVWEISPEGRIVLQPQDKK